MKSIATLALLCMATRLPPWASPTAASSPLWCREEMSDVIYERNGQQYQLLDLLSDSYKTFKTVRGTPVADLEGESWVDEAYLTSATTMPKGVKVVITDEDGEIYVPSSVEKPDLGTLDETTNVALNASVQGQVRPVRWRGGVSPL